MVKAYEVNFFKNMPKTLYFLSYLALSLLAFLFTFLPLTITSTTLKGYIARIIRGLVSLKKKIVDKHRMTLSLYRKNAYEFVVYFS